MTRKVATPVISFPWAGKFQSVDELQQYFDQEKLVCLLCGKLCIQLAAHVGPSHKVTADEYKYRFGIPWTYGLAGKGFREKSARRITATRKAGALPAKPSHDHVARLIASARGRRANVAAIIDQNRSKLLATHNQEHLWGMEEFNEYLVRIASGRTPAEVGHDHDMPTFKWLNQYLRRHPHLRKRYAAVCDGVPNRVKARARKLGPKFLQEVQKLRSKGVAWKTIALKLDVNESTARNAWHTLKKSNEPTPGRRG